MRKKPTPENSPPFISIVTVIALLLVLWLTGCATPPAPPPSLPVKSVQIQTLPSFARQPPMPPECLPSCESGLTTERESWHGLLMTLTLPGLPANGDTKRRVKP